MRFPAFMMERKPERILPVSAVVDDGTDSPGKIREALNYMQLTKV